MIEDPLEQEQAAATVFSYLIRGVSAESLNSPDSEKMKNIRSMLMEKMEPMKRLYAMSDEVYPLYVDNCIRQRKFMKIPEAIEVFGKAMESGRVSSFEERAMMQWITEIMKTNKTTGNIKTKRR